MVNYTVGKNTQKMKLVEIGNEYCSKLEKEYRFRVICTSNISYLLEFSLNI